MIWPEIKPNSSFNLLKETLNGSLFFCPFDNFKQKRCNKNGIEEKNDKAEIRNSVLSLTPV
jgi:hypothetical protein